MKQTERHEQKHQEGDTERERQTESVRKRETGQDTERHRQKQRNTERNLFHCQGQEQDFMLDSEMSQDA